MESTVLYKHWGLNGVIEECEQNTSRGLLPGEEDKPIIIIQCGLIMCSKGSTKHTGITGAERLIPPETRRCLAGPPMLYVQLSRDVLRHDRAVFHLGIQQF